MPIDTTHPSYAANIEKWQRCRDAIEGEDAVKAAGVTYLPKLGGQDPQEYGAYKMRALYYEAVGRTIEGFIGAVARKEPVVNVPAKFEPVVEDLTGTGVGLLEYIKTMVAENLLMGRAGILVDFDETSARSYLTPYTAEAITNWFDGGKTGVVLRETAFEVDASDRFKVTAIVQYREIALVDGACIVNIWRKKQTAGVGEEWVVYDTRTPTIRGAPLAEIPFFWLSPKGSTSSIEKSPLLGMVNVSMSHYRSSADLEHGRHFTGLPTLWVSGASDEGEPIRVGAATVLRLPDPQSKCGYAEFTGQGLGSLETALTTKEHMMAALGAAIIGEVRKGVEAAETARIRTSGETSLLIGVVNAVEETIEAALTRAAEWMGVPGEIEVEINRDFVDTILSPQQVIALLKAWQAGAISLETFLHNLAQGEMLPPGLDIVAEAAALQAKADKAASDAKSADDPADELQ